MYIIVGDGVEMCTAKGKQFPLGTPFSFMDGCYEYNCDCQRDGSWDCPAERARNRCHHTVDQHTEPEQGNKTFFYFLFCLYVCVRMMTAFPKE